MDPLAAALANDAAATPAADAVVGVNWALFNGIYTTLDQPLQNAVDGIIGALTGYVVGPLKWFVVAWLAGSAILMAIKPDQVPLNTMFSQLTRAAIVLFVVANTGNFNQFVGTLFLTTLPTEIGNAIAGPIGGVATTGGAPFDALWNKCFTSGLVVYSNLPSLSLKGAMLSIPVFVYWGVALAAIGLGFLYFLAAHVLLALEVALGPLFISMFIFPATRHFFSGWLSAVMSTVLSQVIIVALISLMFNVENTAVAAIVAQPAGANPVGQIGALMGVGALLFICAILIKQIPAIATGMAGGVYHQTSAYSAALATPARAAASTAASAAGSAVRAMPISEGFIGRTAGRSLS